MALTRPRLTGLDTNVMAFADPITVLHQGATSANVDVGFLFNRANGLVSNVAIYWSESGNTFVTAFTSNSGVTNGNIVPSSYANLTVGSLLTVNGAGIVLAPNAGFNLNGTYGEPGQLLASTGTGVEWLPAGGFNGGSVSGNIVAASGTDSTSTTTGAIVVIGGIGLSGKLTVGGTSSHTGAATFGSTITSSGNIVAASGTSSTNTTTGALVVTGGAGISGKVYVGDTLTVTGSILPSANVTYDLGSGSQRWKDLYLSGSTINLNGATISASAGKVTFTNDVGGSFSVTGSASGQSTGTFGNLVANSGITSTSTTTGALQVSGGAGIAGNIYLSGNIVGSSNGAWTIPMGTTAQRPGAPSQGMIRYNSTISSFEGYGAGSAWSSLGGVKSVDGYAYISAEASAGAGDDVLRFYSGSTGSSVQVMWASAGNISILPTTTSTSSSTGALQVSGGTGIAGALYVGGTTNVTGVSTLNGNVVATSGTASTSVTTGALVVVGGMGVSGDIYVGGTLTVANLQARGSTSIVVQDPMTYFQANAVYPWVYDTGLYSDSIGGPANTYVHHGMVRSVDNGFWGFFSNVKTEPDAKITWSDAGLIWDKIKAGDLILANSTSSSSTTTGALQVSGGAGIAGALYVGGTISAPTIGNTGATLTGTISTASQPNITTLAGVTSIGASSSTTLTGTIQTASQTNVTTLGNLTALTVAGTSTRGGKAMVTNFTGATAPANPQQGDEWWYTTGNILYKYINDGTTSNWINITSSLYNASTSATASTLALRDTGGNLTATNFLGVASSAKYADLAEIYVSDETYAPGTVVVFGGEKEITVTNQSHDARVAGVISTNPAYLMNSECAGLPVAFTGRVPCRVQGPVTKGQLLVTSTTLGVAQAIDNNQFVPGCVVGKSLENITTNEIATIEVVVGRF